MTTRVKLLTPPHRSVVRATSVNNGHALDASRVGSVIRRLIKPARGAGWVLGIFDSNGDLLDFAMEGFQLNRRQALGMLCAQPLGESSSVATLKVTGDDGKLAPTLGASILLEGARSLVLLVVRPPTTEKAWSLVAQSLQVAVRRIAALIYAEALTALEAPRVPTPSHNGGSGFFLLSSDLTVVLQWHPQDAASKELARLVEPHDGALPVLLERAVRRLTSTWDFARIETCSAATAHPLPELDLRVAPVRGAGVLIGVFLEPHLDHPIEQAATAFRISPRERQVVHALFDGHRTADIAAMLNLAESTVNDHIARVIAKTNANNRVEMAATLLGWPSFKSAQSAARSTRKVGAL
jgi:DNA-binding CsgD family transcriptional regulator